MPELPSTAAWRHLDARDGFEVLFVRRVGAGLVLEGHVSAVDDGEAWAVRYVIEVDGSWVTRAASVAGWSTGGKITVRLEGDGRGGWRVDGAPAPALDGCVDVDLEASAATNALPVARLALAVGERAEAPGAYVRARDLRVGRLEQSYARVDDEEGRSRYDYAAPAFDFTAALVYDGDGLVREYPGIAVRVR